MLRVLRRLLPLGLALAACAAPRPAAERDAIAELERVCRHEQEQKGLPALSIALVDGDRMLWSAGFGEESPGRPARGDTIHRVGSVSKLFTDLALMQLVERGLVSLDDPVTALLPDFAPRDPFGAAPITFRLLAAHRAGLVREPPVGHYFADDEPSLAATVASLNGTALVCPPDTRTKYSNAGIAVIGRALEAQGGAPYAELMRERVLRPAGMRRSGFAPDDAIRARLARALMWSYDRSEAPAPTFELGMAPAGCLYASVEDLARFLRVIFAGGEGPGGRLLQPETLATMMEPMPGPDGKPTRYGVGFAVGSLDGRKTCGHGGALYGFSTALLFLPEERLGVAVAASMDGANSVTDRIAEHALRCLLAAREGREPPRLALSEPLPPARAAAMAGRWRAEDGERADLVARGERLTIERRGMVHEVRLVDGAPTVDDRHGFGLRVEDGEEGALTIGGKRLLRLPEARPEACPERWREYLGEYGWDHNVLLVREKDGGLEARIEWFWIEPLEEKGPDLFALPVDRGLYPLETLRFRRDAAGRVTAAVLGEVVFERRPSAAEGEVFRIVPEHPPEELRRLAAAARPPRETGPKREPDLVDLAPAVPGLRFDVRYAGERNFLGVALYPEARAFLQRPAAEALARAQARLEGMGYGLLIHDAYRPWHVTKMFWDATPAEHRHFVADPSEGSRHNRGCAVDLTLVDLASGRPIAMTGVYDEFSARSYPEYPGGTSLQRWHREVLRSVMESSGFRVYEWEWWHFDFDGWQDWPILDASFAELDAAAR